MQAVCPQFEEQQLHEQLTLVQGVVTLCSPSPSEEQHLRAIYTFPRVSSCVSSPPLSKEQRLHEQPTPFEGQQLHTQPTPVLGAAHSTPARGVAAGRASHPCLRSGILCSLQPS